VLIRADSNDSKSPDGFLCGSYGYGEKFRKEVATLVYRSGRIRLVENFVYQVLPWSIPRVEILF
jgi:hypothetical protein